MMTLCPPASYIGKVKGRRGVRQKDKILEKKGKFNSTLVDRRSVCVILCRGVLCAQRKMKKRKKNSSQKPHRAVEAVLGAGAAVLAREAGSTVYRERHGCEAGRTVAAGRGAEFFALGVHARGALQALVLDRLGGIAPFGAAHACKGR